jgi:hypothetical protein
LSIDSRPSDAGSKSASKGSPTEVGRGTLEQVEFGSGVKCTTVKSGQGVGVSCDFSALTGADLSVLKTEEADFKNGTAHQVVTKDRVCVTAETAQAISVDCYYA